MRSYMTWTILLEVANLMDPNSEKPVIAPLLLFIAKNGSTLRHVGDKLAGSCIQLFVQQPKLRCVCKVWAFLQAV